jgi:hypothetical protein
MKSLFIVIIATFVSVPIASSAVEKWKGVTEDPEHLHRAIKKITDIIIEDIFSPPVASRIYAYVCLAGYEAAVPGNPAYLTLAGQIPHLKPVPRPEAAKVYSFTLASVNAVLIVGRTLVFSSDEIEAFRRNLMDDFKKSGIPREIFENSVGYGEQVAQHILTWAAKDNYRETRSMEKHSFSDDPGAWQPTPPAYMKAIEPHWHLIRPFLLTSAGQFQPLPSTPFSQEKDSQFYKEAKEVHDIGSRLTDEQKEIANFWDCNPFKMNVTGHLMFATKKISPGGHWINIAALACKKTQADFWKSVSAYASLSLTLADGFISCWEEKYRSNVIRPETYINQEIDASWVPLLQTPPFPEYTSGHSVISTASAIMLTKLFGENFQFSDSTEVEFGLPVRSFRSFKHAAKEAAISRLYGGIHYMPAIVNGEEEGRQVGNFLVEKVRTRKDDLVFENK